MTYSAPRRLLTRGGGHAACAGRQTVAAGGAWSSLFPVEALYNQWLQQHLGGDSGNWPKPSRYTVHRHWPGLVAFFHDGRPPTVVEGGLARYLAPTCTRAPGGYKRRDVRLDATEGLPWCRGWVESLGLMTGA